MALNLELNAIGISQLGRYAKVVKDLVIISSYVIHRMLVRDMQHAAIAKKVVQRNLHEQGRLPDSSAGCYNADAPSAEPAVYRLLEIRIGLRSLTSLRYMAFPLFPLLCKLFPVLLDQLVSERIW